MRVVLGRKRKVLVALVRSLTRSLIEHGKITTTHAKAKAIRPFVEKLVTLSRQNSVASFRLVSARLGNDTTTASKLATEIAPKYVGRPGGYTRITKLGSVGRVVGEQALIEFV